MNIPTREHDQHNNMSITTPYLDVGIGKDAMRRQSLSYVTHRCTIAEANPPDTTEFNMKIKQGFLINTAIL